MFDSGFNSAGMASNTKASEKENVPNIVNSLGMDFVYINPGSFFMGSSEGQESYPHEKQHKVILTKGFHLQTTEVTVGQWRCFANDGYRTEAEIEGWAWCHAKNGWKIHGILPAWSWQKKPGTHWDKPGFYQTDDYPVTCISWNDTQAFIKWLNLKENANYRLPTEAEWEYSCRAGTQTIYSFGDDITRKHANYTKNKRLESLKYFLAAKRTRMAGKYPPNSWGLYNMHGNVWEWCHDYCDNYFIEDTYIDNITDPLCVTGCNRILRGGSWYYSKKSCRSSHRRRLTPDTKANGIGFRLALVSA